MSPDNLRKSASAFTLVELLVSMAVMTLIMAMMFAILSSIQTKTTRSTQNIEAFRAARNAYESITRRIGQATLNTYWAYDNPAAPTRYKRRSELRFISGSAEELIGDTDPDDNSERRFSHAIFFQAPLGESDTRALKPLANALNTWGYYIEHNSDEDDIPDVLKIASKNRFRLMEFREPTENLRVYEVTSGNPDSISKDWLTEPMNEAIYQHTVADNILAMSILPKLSSRDDETGLALVNGNNSFLYDSSVQGQGLTNPFHSSLHQLPPLVEVTLVAIDESSAQRLEISTDLPEFMDFLDGLFLAPDQLESDLAALESELTDRRLNYRVFSTEIPIQASKWSVE